MTDIYIKLHSMQMKIMRDSVETDKMTDLQICVVEIVLLCRFWFCLLFLRQKLLCLIVCRQNIPILCCIVCYDTVNDKQKPNIYKIH